MKMFLQWFLLWKCIEKVFFVYQNVLKVTFNDENELQIIFFLYENALENSFTIKMHWKWFLV